MNSVDVLIYSYEKRRSGQSFLRAGRAAPRNFIQNTTKKIYEFESTVEEMKRLKAEVVVLKNTVKTSSFLRRRKFFEEVY